jgi:hypothetical protein
VCPPELSLLHTSFIRAAGLADRRPVESLAQAFDVPVEVVLLKDLIQSCVEGMSGAARQILGRQPHRHLLRMSLPFAPSPSATV